MENILLVIHLLIAIALVAVVLMQRSEGGALGIGGGGGGGSGGPGMFSARGAANALTRTTAILAAAFMSTSLALAIVAGGERESDSIFDSDAPPAAEQPAPPSDEPTVPLSQ